MYTTWVKELLEPTFGGLHKGDAIIKDAYEIQVYKGSVFQFN